MMSSRRLACAALMRRSLLNAMMQVSRLLYEKLLRESAINVGRGMMFGIFCDSD